LKFPAAPDVYWHITTVYVICTLPLELKTMASAKSCRLRWLFMPQVSAGKLTAQKKIKTRWHASGEANLRT